MFELTQAQCQQLSEPEPVAIDPVTQEQYTLLAVWEDIRRLLHMAGMQNSLLFYIQNLQSLCELSPEARSCCVTRNAPCSKVPR